MPTDAELRATAAAEVEAGLKAQRDPLIREQGTLAGREETTVAGIGSMFDKLQPIVEGQTQGVSDSYDAANNASRSIFEEAQRRMDQLAQGRAASAQQLAQQMGGPVSVGEFMSGVAPAQNALAQIAPNQLLHGLANAQAGVQQAAAFSGQVFPAMRTEQVANARNRFEEQINDIRKQIEQINASSTGLVDKRKTELEDRERQYALELEKLKLDRLKASHDWTATLRTLHDQQVRTGLAVKGFAITESQQTGKYKGKPTLAAIKLQADVKNMTANQKLAAKKLGLSNKQYVESVRHHTMTEAVARQKANQAAQKNAMSIVDAITGKMQGALTLTRRHPISAQQAAFMVGDPKLEIVSKKVKGKIVKTYFVKSTDKLSPQQVERQYGSGYAHNPQQMYDALLGANVTAPMALKVTRLKTGIHDFKPGQPPAYTAEDLKRVGDKSFQELRGIAIQRGFKPDPKHPKDTQFLIDFIISTNP